MTARCKFRISWLYMACHPQNASPNIAANCRAVHAAKASKITLLNVTSGTTGMLIEFSHLRALAVLTELLGAETPPLSARLYQVPLR